MRFFGVLASLLPFAFASTPSFTADDVEHDALEARGWTPGGKPHCPKHGGVHFVVVSEFGAPRRKGYGGTVAPLMEMVKTSIPYSTNYSVPYPKTHSASSQLVKTAAVGARHVRKYMRWYRRQCPTAPLVLLAYSEGALIMSNGLCGRSHVGSPDQAPLEDEYVENIIAVILYGDPTFVSGQTWDQGTCTTGYGQNPRQTPSNCDAFGATMQSYCVVGDPVCCRGPDSSQHYVYASQYNGDAYNWIMNQYQNQNQTSR